MSARKLSLTTLSLLALLSAPALAQEQAPVVVPVAPDAPIVATPSAPDAPVVSPAPEGYSNLSPDDVAKIKQSQDALLAAPSPEKQAAEGAHKQKKVTDALKKGSLKGLSPEERAEVKKELIEWYSGLTLEKQFEVKKQATAPAKKKPAKKKAAPKKVEAAPAAAPVESVAPAPAITDVPAAPAPDVAPAPAAEAPAAPAGDAPVVAPAAPDASSGAAPSSDISAPLPGDAPAH